MAVQQYKPTTPGRRGMTSQDNSQITTKKPVKSLLVRKKSTAGRNNMGRITVRHRGGGAKKFYRLVNFNLPEGTKAVVEQIEYDPNRSARIARIKDESGKYHYVIANSKTVVGQNLVVGEDAPVKVGNRKVMDQIPVGSFIYDVELTPGRGGQMVRSAGATAQLMAKEGKYATVKLPSGEVRLVHLTCQATLGTVGNEQHQNMKIGQAGRNRHKGIRPTVRGKAMNAADHPHGGGDGGAHPVGRIPKTPWGQKTLGYKTRRRNSTDKYIVKSRHKSKRS